MSPQTQECAEGRGVGKMGLYNTSGHLWRTRRPGCWNSRNKRPWSLEESGRQRSRCRWNADARPSTPPRADRPPSTNVLRRVATRPPPTTPVQPAPQPLRRPPGRGTRARPHAGLQLRVDNRPRARCFPDPLRSKHPPGGPSRDLPDRWVRRPPREAGANAWCNDRPSAKRRPERIPDRPGARDKGLSAALGPLAMGVGPERLQRRPTNGKRWSQAELAAGPWSLEGGHRVTMRANMTSAQLTPRRANNPRRVAERGRAPAATHFSQLAVVT